MTTSKQRLISFEAACAQYLYRFTMEHVPQWARQIKTEYGKYHAPQYASDREWYDNTAFPGEEGHPGAGFKDSCFSTGATWPLGKELSSVYVKGQQLRTLQDIMALLPAAKFVHQGDTPVQVTQVCDHAQRLILEGGSRVLTKAELESVKQHTNKNPEVIRSEEFAAFLKVNKHSILEGMFSKSDGAELKYTPPPGGMFATRKQTSDGMELMREGSSRILTNEELCVVREYINKTDPESVKTKVFVNFLRYNKDNIEAFGKAEEATAHAQWINEREKKQRAKGARDKSGLTQQDITLLSQSIAEQISQLRSELGTYAAIRAEDPTRFELLTKELEQKILVREELSKKLQAML